MPEGSHISAKAHRLNGDITSPDVRLIDASGENRGVVSISEAMQIAADEGMDLVEIVPTATPPVCRVMDHGKFRFEENKKQQQSKKRQKQIQVKEVKFRPTTDIGDYNVKLRNLKRFLEEGNKGKVTIRYRGRELAHKELGADLLKRVEEDLGDLAVVEQRPKMEGRQMIMIVSPKK